MLPAAFDYRSVLKVEHSTVSAGKAAVNLGFRLGKSLGGDARFQGFLHDVPQFLMFVAQQQYNSRRL